MVTTHPHDLARPSVIQGPTRPDHPLTPGILLSRTTSLLQPAARPVPPGQPPAPPDTALSARRRALSRPALSGGSGRATAAPAVAATRARSTLTAADADVRSVKGAATQSASAGPRSGQESRSATVWPGLAFRWKAGLTRSEEHTSELQSRVDLVCRLLLEKKKKKK